MYKPYYDAQSCALFFVDGPLEDRNYFGGKINVFVCGGLQHCAKMASLIGRNAPFAPAAIRGHLRTWERINGKDIAFMIPDSNDPYRVLTGVVWLDLSGEDVRKIETFELQNNLRRRINVNVHVGERIVQAITYIKR